MEANKWVLDQIKLLEAGMIKVKKRGGGLFWFGFTYQEKTRLNGKTIMIGEVQGNRKRQIPNTRWIDSLKETLSYNLQNLSKSLI